MTVEAVCGFGRGFGGGIFSSLDLCEKGENGGVEDIWDRIDDDLWGPKLMG